MNAMHPEIKVGFFNFIFAVREVCLAIDCPPMIISIHELSSGQAPDDPQLPYQPVRDRSVLQTTESSSTYTHVLLTRELILYQVRKLYTVSYFEAAPFSKHMFVCVYDHISYAIY